MDYEKAQKKIEELSEAAREIDDAKEAVYDDIWKFSNEEEQEAFKASIVKRMQSEWLEKFAELQKLIQP